jgi:tetratricopeptide (TPR) repeat protein
LKFPPQNLFNWTPSIQKLLQMNSQFPNFFNQGFPFGEKKLVKPVKEKIIQQHEDNLKQNVHNENNRNLTNYSPGFHNSSVPFSSLKLIYFSGMMEEKVYNGFFILVQSICDPTMLISTALIVEDSTGSSEKLFIYNLFKLVQTNQQLVSIFPKGIKMIIKEPYYKVGMDGVPMIRVDSPTDIIFLSNNDILLKEVKFPTKIKKSNLSFEELKDRGNSLFSKGEYLASIRFYDCCLELDPRNSLVHNNKSLAYFKLEMFSKSLKSALESISQDPFFSKAFFRKGMAEYSLKCFEVSLKSFKDSRLLTNDSKLISQIDIMLENANECLKNNQGKFNFKEMRAKSKKEKYLDCGDFMHPQLEIKEIKDKGIGIKTNLDIEIGSVLLVSKGYSVQFDEGNGTMLNHDFQGKSLTSRGAEINFKNIMKKIYSEPDDHSFFQLSSGENSSIPERIQNKNRSAQRVKKMIQTNAFYPSPDVEKKRNDLLKDGSGVWIIPSFINHSCDFNCVYEFIGDVFVLKNCKPLKKNEEITISYVPVEQFIQKRQKDLSTKNINCKCSLCMFEQEDLKFSKEIESFEAKREIIVSQFRKIKGMIVGDEFLKNLNFLIDESSKFQNKNETIYLLILLLHISKVKEPIAKRIFQLCESISVASHKITTYHLISIYLNLEGEKELSKKSSERAHEDFLLLFGEDEEFEKTFLPKS